MNVEYSNCKRYMKYKNKFRLLITQIPSYQNKYYIDLKEKYNNNIKLFHKYHVKLLFYKNKNYKFKIALIGYDGNIKHIYEKPNKTKIFQNLNLLSSNNIEFKKDNKGLSLYENYNPKTTLKGLGFKNEKTALETIKKIKNKHKIYQRNVCNTMYYRALYHPHQTNDMKKAMKIFKDYLKKLN